MVSRIRYWLMTHHRVGRPLKVMGWLQLLSCVAVGTAPDAAASTNAVVLNWTGLHDTYGVPAGDLYLSLASLTDQLTQTGPDASMLDPTTWWPWMMHGLAVMFDGLTAANILTAEISLAVGIFTLALWVFRLTISSYWLTVLGELARAITMAVISVTTRWGLVAITVPFGVFMGVLAIRRGERGRGGTLIMLALFMPALAVSVFSDPAGLMYGPNGLLPFGRRMAFSTAQAATYGGAISGGGFTGQVDTLTSSLVTHVLREPLEVFNFGHVVDRVGACGPMVSAAWKQGAKDGPIKALAQCGDTAAVHYAQNLDGTNVLGGAILFVTAFLFGWFMVSSGFSVFKISLKAIYTTAKLLPSIYAGSIDGAAREHAKATVWKYFKHPIEVMVFITFVSVIGLAIERLISRPLPAELGGANPFAHVLMTGAASMAALYLLRHIRADLEGTHAGRGVLGRATDVALGMGMHAALGGAGKAALGGATGLRTLLGHGKTPWEKMDEKAASSEPQRILGPAQAGFDPVPGEDGSGTGEADDGGSTPATASSKPAGAGGGTPALTPPDPGGQELNPVISASGGRGGHQGKGPQRRPSSRKPAAIAGSAPVTEAIWGQQPEIDPVASAEHDAYGDAAQHRARDFWSGRYDADNIPPVEAYIDHTGEVPLPPEPPDDPVPPPPDDAASSPANVDPISDP